LRSQAGEASAAILYETICAESFETVRRNHFRRTDWRH
jgi:hypothetical protein